MRAFTTAPLATGDETQGPRSWPKRAREPRKYACHVPRHNRALLGDEEDGLIRVRRLPMHLAPSNLIVREMYKISNIDPSAAIDDVNTPVVPAFSSTIAKDGIK